MCRPANIANTMAALLLFVRPSRAPCRQNRGGDTMRALTLLILSSVSCLGTADPVTVPIFVRVGVEGVSVGLRLSYRNLTLIVSVQMHTEHSKTRASQSTSSVGSMRDSSISDPHKGQRCRLKYGSKIVCGMARTQVFLRRRFSAGAAHSRLKRKRARNEMGGNVTGLRRQRHAGRIVARAGRL